MELVDSALLARLNGLRLRVRAVMDSLLTGGQPSLRQGFSLEFSEHRPYSPGDDFRKIDWKVVARRDRYYVRESQHESRLRVVGLLDTSGSMRYRSAQSPLSKLDYAAVLAASLLWVWQRQGDDVGLACCEDQCSLYMPPSAALSVQHQMIPALERLLAQSPVNSPNTPDAWTAWERLLRRLPARCVVLIFSDFFGDVERLGRLLRLAKSLRHEIRLIQILDPAEVQFPFTEPIRFHALEGRHTAEVAASRIRAAYLKEFQTYQKALAETCRSAGVPVLTLETTASLDLAGRQVCRQGCPQKAIH